MDKRDAAKTLSALDDAIEMKDISEKEIMAEIMQAWSKTSPADCDKITKDSKELRKDAPQLGERGIIELAAKLGMFLRANEG